MLKIPGWFIQRIKKVTSPAADASDQVIISKVDEVLPSGEQIAPAPTQTGAPLLNGTPIPVYPSKGVAAIAASPDLLIESQKNLIKKIHQQSSLDREIFNEMVLPAIWNYAAYVHLLPASESHHHCGQGGLFRHGLEVASYAANACNATIFAFDHWASERDKLVPRWRMCAILAAMIHDMGKPIVDIGAVDATGDRVWSPHAGSLWEWLCENNLNEYYIFWKEGQRHKRHEIYNTLTMDRIIPRKTLGWLSEFGGQEAIDAMIRALSGPTDPNNPISEIIKKSDSLSVEQDIKNARTLLAQSGLGAQRNLVVRLVRSIHDKLESGDWEINQIGSLIWVTQDGIYGIYPQLIAQAIDALREKGETGLARDATAVLLNLADWGYIVPNVVDGKSYNTMWVNMVTTDRGKSITFDAHVIRFAKEEIIPAAMLPKQTATVTHLKKNKDKSDTGGDANPSQSEPSGTPSGDANPSQSEPNGTPGGDANPSQSEPNGTPGGDANPSQSEPSATPGGDANPSQPEPSATRGGDANPSQSEPRKKPIEVRDRSSEIDLRDLAMQEARDSYYSDWPPKTPEKAEAWLKTQGWEGSSLLMIINRFQTGELVDGKDAVMFKKHLHYLFPKCFRKIGSKENELRTALEAKKWIIRDDATLGKATVTIDVNGKQEVAVRFNEELTQILNMLTPALNLTPSNKLPPKRFPLGPYIDKDAATKITTGEYLPMESCVIRTCFYLYLDDHLRDNCPDDSIDSIDEATMQTLIAEFNAKHRHISKPLLISHLSEGTNPILKKQGDGQGVNLTYNPDYDREADLKESVNLKATHER